MTIILLGKDIQELWEEAKQNSRDLSCIGDDVILEYPRWLGNGYRKLINLRSGISLVIHDYEYRDQLLLKLEPCQSDLEFVFNIAGNYQLNSDYLGAGQSYLQGSLAPKMLFECPALKRFIEVDIHIELDIFKSFIADKSEQIPPSLRRIVAAVDEQPYLHLGTTSLVMQQILQQILHCPYQGITRQMYLEGKVLELLALQLEQAIANHQAPNQLQTLRPDDIERIYQAKQILIQNLDNPPSLMTLARQVGLNDFKLKLGFRQVFGTTVFGYLHEHRMEQAQQLLKERRMNVEEVARTIGYANRSSFAAAFRKKFGVNPKSYTTARLKQATS